MTSEAMELTGDELDAVVGGATPSMDAVLLEAVDDLLTAISCAFIGDERVEEKALALASVVATIRRT